MEKVFVVQRMAQQLWTTEAAVDTAIVEASAMMRELIEGRRDMHVSPIFADQVNVKLMEAMKALTEARTAMVGVHNEMSEAQLRLGVRTKMDWVKPNTMSAEQPRIREAV